MKKFKRITAIDDHETAWLEFSELERIVRLFGLFIMTTRQVENYRREIALQTAYGLKRLCEPRGIENDGDFGRGMSRACKEIQLYINDIRE